MARKRPRAVYVEWDDHVLHPGTHDTAQLDALLLAFQQTVGWLVREDDEVLGIAQSIDDQGDFQDVLLVDKRMLRRRRFLEGAE